MPGRIRKISGHRRETLDSGWELAHAPPGSALAPDAASRSLDWKPIGALATVAAALRSLGEWSLDEPARRFDAQDWWYRIRFVAPERATGARAVLGMDGLATVADAWLNGELLVHSENMFHAHEFDVTSRLAASNELLLHFHSLDALLAQKRPRPRWRAPMVENQQLRWFRTTLLGRTPGWSPPAAVVGPWRPIWIESRIGFEVRDWNAEVTIQGADGIIDASCRISGTRGAAPVRVELVAERSGTAHRAPLQAQAGTNAHVGKLKVPGAQLWWPHTHGEPALYALRLEIHDGTSQQPQLVELGWTGFRTIDVDTREGDFAVSVNGERVFCRGACWTPPDCVSFECDDERAEATVAQARDAGMNMLRVGGTMVYESNAFLDACDRHGMLLWQDLMFANMDYPEGDAVFDASVAREAQEQLRRLSGRPCLTVICGNSEGEQQAAMWGAARERWSPTLFHETLAKIAASLAPQAIYWPSSAHGGAFPHQGDSGTTSYYGVGAYRRPLTDARRAAIRFASECLAFANVPEDSTLDALGPSLKVHQPQWKARVPRDLGAGWDFDDVRDHYLAEIFGVAPLDLRYADHERYLRASRAASGEAMAAAFREWRRKDSSCRGALIWFLRDLWPGAGWGVVDSNGTPKSTYYFLRRLLQPRALLLTDEGTNGLHAHLVNETAEPIEGSLEVALFRASETPVGHAREAVRLAPRESRTLAVGSLFESFMDLTYAYRFGPPGCDVVVATLTDPNGAQIARDFYFPLGHTLATEPDVGFSAAIEKLNESEYELALTARRTARFVTIHVENYDVSEQYFHLAPAIPHRVRLKTRKPLAPLKGHVAALNSVAICKIAVP